MIAATTTPVPSDASLDDWLKAAGGGFTLTGDAVKGLALTSENGDVIAVVKVNAAMTNDDGVLPDGTVAVTLQPVANPKGGYVAMLKGDAGAGVEKPLPIRV